MEGKKETEKNELINIKINNSDNKSKETKANPVKEETYDIGFVKKPIFWQLSSVVLLILLVISLFSVFGSPTGFSVKDVGAAAAKERVENYVKTVLQGRVNATVGDPIEEEGLYRIDILIQGQKVKSYVTKDSKLFFPNVVDFDEFDKIKDMPLAINGNPTGDEKQDVQVVDNGDIKKPENGNEKNAKSENDGNQKKENPDTTIDVENDTSN